MTIQQQKGKLISRASTGAGRRQQYYSTTIISILLSSLVVVDLMHTSYAHDTNNNYGREKSYPSNNERSIVNAINRSSNNNDVNNQMNNKHRIRRPRGERRELNNIFLPQQHQQEEDSSTTKQQLNKYRIEGDGDINNANIGNDENNKPTESSKVMPDLRIINGVVVSISLEWFIQYLLFYLS